MNCLVTGGAGFIGSHIVRDLLRLGRNVVVLDDLSGGFRDNVPSGVELVVGSVLDRDLINGLFEQNHFSYVYHLAAYAAEGLSHFIKRFNYNNNLIGSINLINASINHRVKCFVFTSSIAVYGTAQLPMREEDIPHPEDPYGVAKYAVELELECSKKMFGLNYIIFRPHNVYGEYQNIGDKYRNVIGIFMNQTMRREPLTIFGDGSQTRAFSYIGGISPIIANSPDFPNAYGQIFNIGADQVYSVKEVAIEVCRVFGVEPNIRYLEARNEVMHAASSHAKVEDYFSEVDIQDLSLHDGLLAMASWVKRHGSREATKFSDIEIAFNMPAVWSL